MRILFVQDSFGAGGAESSNVLLWHYLRSQGIEVYIIVLSHKKEGYENEVIESGFNVLFLRAGNLLQHSYEIANHIQKLSPDIVHSVLFKSNIRVRLAKVFTRFLHIEHLVSCTYDNIRLTDPQINKLGFHIYKYMDILTSIYGVNYFIAITKHVKKHYVKKVKIPESKINVIYRGRHDNSFIRQKSIFKNLIINELGVKNTDLILLHVGRQEYAKGHLVLLKSLTNLYHNHYDLWKEIKILFCGREGNETTAISSYLKQHEFLSENILWLGHRKDIPQLMAAADIFVFPSWYEGLGGSLIEAQAAALPIICSNLTVFQEVVNENDNALMFPVGDHDNLATKIIRLIKDEDLRRSMGNKSLLNFNENFKLDKINEDTLNYYRQLSV